MDEDYFFKKAVVGIQEERVRKTEQLLQDILDDEVGIEQPSEPLVNGMTKTEYVRTAKELHNQGVKKILEALVTPPAAAAASVTTGALAIGLNTGANPLEEWVAGTLVGSKALEANGLKNKKTTITRYSAGAKHPYNFTGDIGWADESSITKR
jgi:hypothetical protein